MPAAGARFTRLRRGPWKSSADTATFLHAAAFDTMSIRQRDVSRRTTHWKTDLTAARQHCVERRHGADWV